MWETHFVDTPRGTFEYFTKGQGEPLAVSHHYSQYNANGNSFSNPFTKSYRVHLINLRGAGNSVGAEEDVEYSMKNTILDLEAIRTALGFEKWAFGGHSTGGMLALVYAIHFPESLTKIIVGGAAASYAYSEHPDCIYNSSNCDYDRIVYIMDTMSNPETPLETRQKLGYEWALMSYHSEENLKRSMQKPNSGKTCGPRLDYFRQVEYHQFDVRPELPTIQVPSFVYTGKYDNQCPLEFGIEIAEAIPNAKFFLFEHSNHFPFSEEEEKFERFVEETVNS